MYNHIAVPVDLAHRDQLDRALETTAQLARTWHARVTMVAVTSPAPGSVAHNPTEFAREAHEFCVDVAQRLGLSAHPDVVVCSDPSADLERALDREFHRIGADLVVVASHVPGFREYIFSSHAGWLAQHSDLSIFVVRG